MKEIQYEIAKFIVRKALAKQKVSYSEISDNFGGAPIGVGKHLEIITDYVLENNYPDITSIVVEKGKSKPSEKAHEHFKGLSGSVSKAQQDVFDYDWSSVPDFYDPDRWITSFWGFRPHQWGCIGFATKGKRDSFVRRTHPSCLVYIYVTKKSPREKEKRGKIVGILEISHQEGDISKFLDNETWKTKESDPKTKGKWSYALKATRAWEVIEEDIELVDTLLPYTYTRKNAQTIGSQGMSINQKDLINLKELTVIEVPVHGQRDGINTVIQTLDKAVLKPSNAVPPAKGSYTVGETDGPKHLYILELEGGVSFYLDRSLADLKNKKIIKVGFSKSPYTRRKQIQSAYPVGRFNWKVSLPDGVPKIAPYPNAKTAIAGEDEMKNILMKIGAESLDGEFFLATEAQANEAWIAGKKAAEKYMSEN